MSLYNGPPRGGSRGGRDQFNWENVKSDKDREFYLGAQPPSPARTRSLLTAALGEPFSTGIVRAQDTQSMPCKEDGRKVRIVSGLVRQPHVLDF